VRGLLTAQLPASPASSYPTADLPLPDAPEGKITVENSEHYYQSLSQTEFFQCIHQPSRRADFATFTDQRSEQNRAPNNQSKKDFRIKNKRGGGEVPQIHFFLKIITKSLDHHKPRL
jgi:hypothetical protein